MISLLIWLHIHQERKLDNESLNRVTSHKEIKDVHATFISLTNTQERVL